MCDYSLHFVANRPAKIGDKIRSSIFSGTSTRGFAAVDQPDMAVCLLPGTELAFENDVRYGGLLGLWRRSAPPLARFRQVNVGNPNVHHDALEFPDGRIVSLQQLATGQNATVLQLPTLRKHDQDSAAPGVVPATVEPQPAGHAD